MRDDVEHRRAGRFKSEQYDGCGKPIRGRPYAHTDCSKTVRRFLRWIHIGR